MDRLTSILIAAGLACFALSFALSGLYPWLITDHKEPEATIEVVARNVPLDFKDLKDVYPAAFEASFVRGAECMSDKELADAGVGASDPRRTASDDAWRAAWADAIHRGRDRYIAEACWHCHSQYVRPVANEDIRFGPVSVARDDNNVLQRPVMWGTRRVGPDLTHEGGLRTNDWHVAHLWNPTETSPGSVMPRYTWLFDDGFEVRRRIEPDTAERMSMSKDTSYRVASGFPTQAAADAALAKIAASLPESRAEEKARLFVAEAKVPNQEGLAVVSYLQWLGTWKAPTPEGSDQ